MAGYRRMPWATSRHSLSSPLSDVSSDGPLLTSDVLDCRQCHHCQKPDARLLSFNSALSRVNYYRCAACGHVWTEPKPGEDGGIHDVTYKR